MGGTGGGIAYNREEFLDIVERGIERLADQQVLIEESVPAGRSTRWRSSAIARG